MNEVNYPATLSCLAVALFGPALLLTPAHRLLGEAGQLRTQILDLVFLWLLAAVVLTGVVLWEKLPLSSIGLSPGPRSLFAGIMLALFFNRLVAPFLYWMSDKLKLPGFGAGLSKMAGMPTWSLLFAALTAGVVEETLYRGYAIERIALITGSYWVAGLLATAVHALMHLPMWGWGPVATFFVSGGVLTVFYICTKDLTACIIAHAVTDAVGFMGAKREARLHREPGASA